MVKVFQDKFGQGYGNCMSATAASLFHKRLEEVPYFIGAGDDWWEVYMKFLNEQGYEYNGCLYNPHVLGMSGSPRFHELKDEEGIDGYFEATVFSPGLFNKTEYIYNPNYKAPRHAVIVDRYCNIVHDPHPHYQGIKQYPLHEFIGWNGVLEVYLIDKIKSQK